MFDLLVGGDAIRNEMRARFGLDASAAARARPRRRTGLWGVLSALGARREPTRHGSWRPRGVARTCSEATEA